MPRTTAQRAVDDAYLTLGDELARVEERHGVQAALGLMGRLKATTKAAQTPGEARIQRSVSALHGLMGDDDLAQVLEGLIEQVRVEAKASVEDGELESVVKFLAGGQGKRG